MSLQCECGYDLRGVIGDRCPECGRPGPHREPRRKKIYLLSGLSIGFLAFTIPTLVALAAVAYFFDFGGGWGDVPVPVFAALGILIACLIGMLIGYLAYRFGPG